MDTITRTPKKPGLTKKETQLKPAKRIPKAAPSEKSGRDLEVRRLKKELAAAQNKLQKTAGELKHANDKIQTLNEEHAVITEELRVTNEELKAANETLIDSNKRLEEEISARMWAEDAVQKERKQLYSVLETLPVYVILLTHDHRVPFANRFFRDRFGESFGMCCYEYLFNRTEPCENCETYTALKTHQPHRWEWLGPDNRNYDIYDFPFTDSDGSAMILEMGIDVTELKKSQKDLVEANEQLEERVAERTQALAESESNYRNLFKMMSEGFAIHELICDPEGSPADFRFLEINPAFERISGLKAKQVMGKRVSELMPGYDPNWIKRFVQVALTGKPDHFESFSEALNRWYDVFAFRTKPGQFAAFFLDVTERAKSEEAIHRAKEEWEKTFDSIPDLIALLDGQQRIKRANKAMANHLGVTPAQCVGLPCYKAVHGMDAPPSFCPHVKTIADGREHTMEIHEERLGGDFLVTTSPIKDREGRSIGSVHMARDITKIKLAEKALKESQRRLAVVLDSIADGCYAFNREGIITHVNDAALEYFNKRREDMLGNKVSEVFPGIKESAFGKEFERAIQTGIPGHIEAPSLVKDAIVEIHTYPGPDNVTILFRDVTERARMSEALNESSTRLELAMKAANQGAWHYDIAKNKVTASLKMCEIYGLPADCGIHTLAEWRSFILEEDLPLVIKAMEDADPQTGFYQSEYRIRRSSDGEIHWISSHGSIHRDSNGREINRVGIVADITERKKQEEQLRSLNRTLRALSDANEALIHTEDETMLLNEACRIIVEDCGHTMVWIGFAEDDQAKTVHPMAQAGFEDGYLETLDITWADMERGQGPTGTAIRTGKVDMCRNFAKDPRMQPWRKQAVKRGYASSIAIPLKAEGRVLGALTIYAKNPDAFSEEEVELLVELADDLAYGITAIRARIARQQAEDAVRRNEARLKLLSDTAGKLLASENPQAIVNDLCREVMKYLDCHAFFNFLVDAEAGRLHLNAYAGIPDEEAARIQWLDFGAAVCGCAARDKMPIIAENIQTTLDPRTELVKSYGIKAYACHPLMIQGELIGTLSFGTRTRSSFSAEDLSMMRTVTDQVAIAMERIHLIAELRKSNEELELRVAERTRDLKKLNQALERSNKALGEFAYVASHDLQEPLRKIQTFSERLTAMKDLASEKAKDYVARMDNAARRMRILIQDLLTYSRLAANQEPFDRINLKAPVEEAVKDLQLMIEDSQAKIEISALPDVMADSRQMRQLFFNLIGNALKYRGKEKPYIRVYEVASGQADAGQSCEIHVEDNGIGFEMMYADKIFQPFQRLHGRSDVYPGTGIGLAICRRIVENHGGVITAQSVPGHGSTFIVKLPRGGKY